LSNRNPLTLAALARSIAPLPVFVYVRLYTPPGTSRLVQQFSVPWPPAPQSVSPGPLASQLAAAVVEPVHAPLVHIPVAHAHGRAHCPFDPHVCTLPVPEHWVVPGAHSVGPPPLDPELLELEPLEPELPDPELPDPELPDPELPDPEPLLAPELPAPELLLDPALPAPASQPPSAWTQTPPPATTQTARRP